jgi:hypothetical protein
MKLDEDIDYEKITCTTHGVVGEDLAVICIESPMNCIREGMESIFIEHKEMDVSHPNSPHEPVVDNTIMVSVGPTLSMIMNAAGILDLIDAITNESGVFSDLSSLNLLTSLISHDLNWNAYSNSDLSFTSNLAGFTAANYMFIAPKSLAGDVNLGKVWGIILLSKNTSIIWLQGSFCIIASLLQVMVHLGKVQQIDSINV